LLRFSNYYRFEAVD